jgi:hypothetical protein
MTIREKLALMETMKAQNAQRVKVYLNQRGYTVQPDGKWPQTINVKE